MSAAARAALDYDPLLDPIVESGDDRRVRAGAVAVLEEGLESGHTVLHDAGIRTGLATLELTPTCDPTADQYDLAAEEFEPVLRHSTVARGGRGWQLSRLADASALIRATVQDRIDRGPLDATADWTAAVQAAIGEDLPIDGEARELEELARAEKRAALETLARSRIRVLVGPAGTGKTTLLRALCSQPEVVGNVLLVAPTGKARVQLGASVKTARAQTIAQFLRRLERWNYESGYYLNPRGMRSGGFQTIIVDEASMVTEEMLAALIESLKEPVRLILCGDHRQLPPIGAGRPFADLVAHLRGQEGVTGGGSAELTIGRRQLPAAGGKGRDDLAVAATFSTEGSLASADQAYVRAVAGDCDDTVRIVSWSDEDNLHRKLEHLLSAELHLERGASDSLKRALGATGGNGAGLAVADPTTPALVRPSAPWSAGQPEVDNDRRQLHDRRHARPRRPWHLRFSPALSIPPALRRQHAASLLRRRASRRWMMALGGVGMSHRVLGGGSGVGCPERGCNPRASCGRRFDSYRPH